MITWEETLTKIIHLHSAEIEKNGFTSPIKFKEITKELGFSPKSNTPNYVSLDFWSSSGPSQEEFLRSKNLYILRTGSGNFTIIDANKFPKPYLDLNVSSYVELQPSKDETFSSLEDAMTESQENIGLEQLHYFGIYQKLVDAVCGKSKYHIGPRGGQRSSFDVFAKNNLDEIKTLFHFNGPEELDYTLWTEDTIFMIEAKSTSVGKGLDLGWHKIVYPASRFRKYVEQSQYNLIPVYLLRWENIFHIFVFPKLNFHESGIILNDPKSMKPLHCFKIEIPSMKTSES